MKNLIDEELVKSFRDNIMFALKEHKNLSLEIIFKFSEEDSDYKFNDEIIERWGGFYSYKGVRFGFIDEIISQDKIIDIILKNMQYNHFAYIDKVVQIGDVECQGHGEYWGTDKFIFIYKRFKEKK